MDKRGEDFISTLAIFIIAFVVIAIIVNLTYLFQESKIASKKSVSNIFFTQIAIDNVALYETGDSEITVRRNSGGGNITGLNFNFYDQNEQKQGIFIDSKDESMPKTNEQKTFFIDASLLNFQTKIQRVTVIPLIGKSEGGEATEPEEKIIKDKLGFRVLDKPEKLEKIGVIYWLFRENIEDITKSNMNLTLPNNQDIKSISLFFKLNSNNSNKTILEFTGYKLYLNKLEKDYLCFKAVINENEICSKEPILANEWKQVGILIKPTYLELYINGNFENKITGNYNYSNSAIYIGGKNISQRFNGEINQLMIFNKNLTRSHFKALYINQKF